jgi:hypothetical protein
MQNKGILMNLLQDCKNYYQCTNNAVSFLMLFLFLCLFHFFCLFLSFCCFSFSFSFSSFPSPSLSLSPSVLSFSFCLLLLFLLSFFLSPSPSSSFLLYSLIIVVASEKIHQMTQLGLIMEKKLYLDILRDIEQLGNRRGWDSDPLLLEIHNMLYQENKLFKFKK